MQSMATRDIEIAFNGLKEKVPAGMTIADLIERTGENDKNLIVERNNRFVHCETYRSVTLSDGDRVEFINPDFGG